MYGSRLRLAPQIIHARLETRFPRVHVHGGEFGQSGILHEEIHALTLIDKDTPVRRHIYDDLLTDFPYCLVEILDVIWNVRDVLHGATRLDHEIFHLFGCKFNYQETRIA